MTYEWTAAVAEGRSLEEQARAVIEACAAMPVVAEAIGRQRRDLPLEAAQIAEESACVNARIAFALAVEATHAAQANAAFEDAERRGMRLGERAVAHDERVRLFAEIDRINGAAR